MGQLVLYSICSLDGAVDDPNRLFPPPDTSQPAPPEFDDAMEAPFRRLIAGQRAVLLGRGMYDEWARFWPTSQDLFADFINNVPKYVVTSRPLDGGWANAQRVSGSLRDIVTEVKASTDGDVGVHGSVTLAQSLLAEGLVDELHLTVAPVLDPVGRRLTERVGSLTPLTLTDSLIAPSGAMWLTYRLPAAE